MIAETSPLASHLATFLAGVALGMAGTYLADKFTDQRRASEAEKQALKAFKEVERVMPALIAEIRIDVLNDKTRLVREFYPYHIDSICGPGNRFWYDPAKHEDLPQAIQVLENCGYIVNVSESETARYRMSEEFVRLLRETIPS